MNRIIEEAMKAVPCSARLGFLCNTPHTFWSSCCRLMMAIKIDGQPIEIQELEDNELHILMFKRPDAVRESYGVVKLIEPINRLFPKYNSYIEDKEIIEPEFDQDWNIRTAMIRHRAWKFDLRS